ncbi:MAG: HNH endonuclease [Treponema sp.]|jgi:hypothetical protein|nr:HNH endonuclease [Treponema sp.]
MIRKPYRRCTPEEIRYLKENIIGRSYNEITELFNRHFGLRGKKKLSFWQIKGILQRHKLSSGLPRRFLPGHIPHNKGRTSYYFRPGYTAYNYCPIGTERINSRGHVEVKIADPNRWKSKHTLIWEAANGPVPRGHVIIFADKNKLNFSPDNLLLVSKNELMVMNRCGLFFGHGKLAETGRLIADVKLLIAKRKREAGSGRRRV